MGSRYHLICIESDGVHHGRNSGFVRDPLDRTGVVDRVSIGLIDGGHAVLEDEVAVSRGVDGVAEPRWATAIGLDADAVERVGL